MRLLDAVMQSDDIAQFVKEELDGVTVISCDNVSRYFFEETDQEHWDMNDFPNIAPPFAYFWLDMKAPSKVISKERGITIWRPPAPEYWGFQCYGIDLYSKDEQDTFLETCIAAHRDHFQSILPLSRWAMDMYLFVYQQGSITGPMWIWRLMVDDQGQIVRSPKTNEAIVSSGCTSDWVQAQIDELAQDIGHEAAMIDMYHTILPYWYTALLSISFMHCKNTALDPVNPPLKVPHNKNQKRRGVQPYQPVPYKVLDIRPMKEVLRTEGQSHHVDASKALHICRGHFRDYSQGKGLFGKYKGIYWVAQHVKGTSSQGVTTKDYSINLNTRQ